MAFEHPRSPRRALLVGAVLGLACGASAGCATLNDPCTHRLGSICTTGDAMLEGVRRLREEVSPKDRAVIDELISSKDLQIHIFPHELPSWESRAAGSGLASKRYAKQLCPGHPDSEGIPLKRDWDVFYDQRLAEAFENDHGIPSPLEVGLYHEIFGHILLILKDPDLYERLLNDKQLYRANECAALNLENQFRKYRGIREVPPELIGCPRP